MWVCARLLTSGTSLAVSNESNDRFPALLIVSAHCTGTAIGISLPTRGYSRSFQLPCNSCKRRLKAERKDKQSTDSSHQQERKFISHTSHVTDQSKTNLIWQANAFMLSQKTKNWVRMGFGHSSFGAHERLLLIGRLRGAEGQEVPAQQETINVC